MKNCFSVDVYRNKYKRVVTYYFMFILNKKKKTFVIIPFVNFFYLLYRIVFLFYVCYIAPNTLAEHLHLNI